MSGNLRHKIARELNFDVVPVIFRNVEEEEMDFQSLVPDIAVRKKSSVEILKEIQYYDEHFKIGQGKRTDLRPELMEMKEKREKLNSEVKQDTRRKLKKIHDLASELYGKDTPEYYGVFKSIDNGRTTINGQYQNLLDKKQRKENETVIPNSYSIIRENTQIYNKSSALMSEVEDNSIQSIITSPPYFQMRDYGNDDELGQEDDVDKYLRKLILIFKECQRVLKMDGSLFVNINDCVKNGQYQAVPQRFLIQMMRSGWIFNDEMIWIKYNPQYTRGRRAVRSHEYIYHFVKSPDFYYNDSWLRTLKDIDKKIAYGVDKNNPKIISGLDFRDNVLKTKASSTAELRKKCAEKGFHLTHSATYPIDVPTLCGLLTTKKGDTILDCFAGTSVTGEFARKNDRKYIGYELNPQFIMASEVRLELKGLLYIPVSSIEDHEILTPKSLREKYPNHFSDFSRTFNDCIAIAKKYSNN